MRVLSCGVSAICIFFVIFILNCTCHAHRLTVETIVVDSPNAYNDVLEFAAGSYQFAAAANAGVSVIKQPAALSGDFKCDDVTAVDNSLTDTQCKALCRIAFNVKPPAAAVEMFHAYIANQIQQCDWNSVLRRPTEYEQRAIAPTTRTTHYASLFDFYYNTIFLAYIAKNDIKKPKSDETCEAFDFVIGVPNSWTVDCFATCLALEAINETLDVPTLMPVCNPNPPDVTTRRGAVLLHFFFKSIVSALGVLRTPFPTYHDALWSLYKYRTINLLLTTPGVVKHNNQTGVAEQHPFYHVLLSTLPSAEQLDCENSKSFASNLISDQQCIDYCTLFTGLKQKAPVLVQPAFCGVPNLLLSDVAGGDYNQQDAQFYHYQTEMAARQVLDIQLETYRTKIQQNKHINSSSPHQLSSRCEASVPKYDQQVPAFLCAAVCYTLADACDDQCFAYLEIQDVFDCTF